MATFRDLLSAAKSSIAEIDTATAAERIDGGSLVLDVREPDEYAEGAIAGAIHIPRGHLESQIESRIIDKDAPVVVYCAGGVRSAFAVQTMQELGYTGAESMDGGFGRWKDEGRPWKQPASLTAEQNNRYKRHLLLPEVGVAGQVKLLESKVLLLGAGGLGSPAAMYLAAAGVGTIGIVDMDEVDASNLQRQILHNVDRIGDRKVDSAKKTLTALNPDVDVVTYDTRLSAENIIDILTGYDLVVDGADNFPSRYLLNDASVKLGIPVVHGSIFRFEGMVSVFHPLEGPTYRDMVPEPPPAELAPSCAEAGVLGVLPGIVGSIQALEAIKVLLGLGDPLIGRILSVDTTEMEFRVFNLKPDPANRVTYANRDQIQIRDLDGLCARPGSTITESGHTPPPQRHQLLRRAGDGGDAEELRPPVRARVMADADLDEAHADPVEGVHHLDADHARRRRQLDLLHHPRVDEAEVAVGVADRQAEQELDDVVVRATDQLAVPRITAAHLEALDHVDVGGDGVDAAGDLAGVVLGVAIGVEDPLLGRGGEARTATHRRTRG